MGLTGQKDHLYGTCGYTRQSTGTLPVYASRAALAQTKSRTPWEAVHETHEERDRLPRNERDRKKRKGLHSRPAMPAFFASFARAGGSRGPATKLPAKLPFPDAVHAALGDRAAGPAVLEVFAGNAGGARHSVQHAFVCGGAFAPTYRPRLTGAEQRLAGWLVGFLEAAEVQAGCERATFHETHELLDLLRRARAAYADLKSEGWFAVRAGHPRVRLGPRDLLF